MDENIISQRYLYLEGLYCIVQNSTEERVRVTAKGDFTGVELSIGYINSERQYESFMCSNSKPYNLDFTKDVILDIGDDLFINVNGHSEEGIKIEVHKLHGKQS